MKPQYYIQEWQRIEPLKDIEQLRLLASRISHSFIDEYFYGDTYKPEYVDLLCDMATHSEQEELTQPAASALFGIIIEQLCDDFEELQTESYNRLMAQVIDRIRHKDAGQPLNKKLLEFNLLNQQQLYDRIESIRANSDRRHTCKSVKKVIILSRITIGADVAVTSVFCQRLSYQFPDAKIVLIGPDKLQQLYDDNSYVRIAPLNYSRTGNLIDRFNTWLDLSQIIEQESKGFNKGDIVVFDPDSRLSQLGVLPLIDTDNYFFFNSRGKDSYPKKIPIAELANFWLDSVLGPGPFFYPKVWPSASTRETVAQLFSPLKEQHQKNIITINFGNGGNHRKQLSEEFEQLLVNTLLQQENTVIILDMGFGEKENNRNKKILSAAEAKGVHTQACQFEELSKHINNEPGNQIIGVHTNIGQIASLIAQSNEFIGYDSACQHIAASQSVPTYTVFTGSNNVRFIRRWTACGNNTSEIIFVDRSQRMIDEDIHSIVDRVMDKRS